MRAICWILIVTLTWTPAAAHAQVHQNMQDFFNSFDAVVTGTPGGAYQTQTRGYVTGGALSVRVPMQSTQLFSAISPSFRMGCNGFDAHFGSISHVSIDRFVQLVQHLGTGAVLGFAFQLAMQYLSPSIASVLSQLESIARQINQTTNVSPCQMGKQLGADLANVLSGKSEQPMLLQRWNALTGSITDIMDQIHTVATQTPQTVASALAGRTHGHDNWEVRGNIVWDVIDHYYHWLPTDAKFLLMSVIGTVVIDDSGVAQYHRHTIEPNDLLDAQQGQSMTILRCADPATGCLSVTASEVTNMLGFEAMLRTRLSDLIAAVNNGTSIDPAIQNWVNQLAQPIYAIMTAQRTPAQREAYLKNNSRLLAATLVRHFVSQFTWGLSHGLSLYKTRKPNWSGDLRDLYARLDSIARALTTIELDAAQTEAAQLGVTKHLIDLSTTSARLR